MSSCDFTSYEQTTHTDNFILQWPLMLLTQIDIMPPRGTFLIAKNCCERWMCVKILKNPQFVNCPDWQV